MLAHKPSGEVILAGKPPGKAMRNATRRIKWEEEQKDVKHTVGTMKCGDTVQVSVKDDKDVRCPEDCPFFAQDKVDKEFCTFICVANREQCLKYNPDTPIADTERGICRTAMVQNCKEFSMDGTDSCEVCGRGFHLGLDRKCHSKFKYFFYCLGVFFLVLLAIIVFWIVDMVMRPIYNGEVLMRSLQYRSHQKLRKVSEGGNDGFSNRELWPVFTNMIREAPAGAGMMLHFNFQAAVVVWGLCIGLGWVALAAIVDGALFTLGTRKYGSPRENCILVAWGYETQQRLMWTKVLFLQVVYVFTFVGSIWFAIRQLRLFQDFDCKNKTMKDFVAMITNLPPLSGERLVENELKESISSATGVPVVGVSVAWNFKEFEEDFGKVLEHDMVRRDPVLRRHNSDVGAGGEIPKPENMGCITSILYDAERSALAPSPEDEEVMSADKVKETLKGMQTSHTAFAVFETEALRDRAIAQLQANDGLEFEGQKAQLETLLSEPDTVQWASFGNASVSEQLSRLFVGFGAIFAALCFWSLVFYAPYAWAVMSFNYANGQQPGIIYGISFSMVVVVGNQIMYEVCARVSDYVGFRFSDTRAVCYMILFTVACLWNVCVDMVTTYYVAEQIMMELGFRTYHGKLLTEVPTFTSRFETYAMQRTLAENTYSYAFPSTFLIPFLLEPVATVLGPLMMGVYIVGSHPEIRGREAENWVAAAPIDLGRYADILLNMVLAILIFYFPGGYTHTLFIALGLSHIYIFAMDQYKLLRSAPNITVATMEVDWWAQALLAPCCGLILSCLVFKANCQDYGYCLDGAPLILSCTSAFFVHCALHTVLQCYVVPLFGTPPLDEADDPCAHITFKDVSEVNPVSWFTTNPVHCLRSEHIYGHQPPCRFLISGKEHLIDANPSIGCFFRGGKVASSEDFRKIRSEMSFEEEEKKEDKSAA
jgi:hypothetical protein